MYPVTAPPKDQASESAPATGRAKAFHKQLWQYSAYPLLPWQSLFWDPLEADYFVFVVANSIHDLHASSSALGNCCSALVHGKALAGVTLRCVCKEGDGPAHQVCRM